MLACQNRGQNDWHVFVRPTCHQHVGRHVGNTTQKAVGRGTANVGPICHLPTCWQHVGNMLALIAGIFAALPSLGWLSSLPCIGAVVQQMTTLSPSLPMPPPLLLLPQLQPPLSLLLLPLPPQLPPPPPQPPLLLPLPLPPFLLPLPL